MDKRAIELILERLHYLKANKDNITIDGDTHPSPISILTKEQIDRLGKSPDYYQGKPITVEELLWEMKVANVDMALSWQNPAATPYNTDPEYNFNSLLQANQYIYDIATKHPEILPAGWTDPSALGIDKALKMVELCVKEFGFPIVKMNPAQNEFYIDSEDVYTIVIKITELGATPAFHYGGDTKYTPAKGLVNIARQFPDSRIIGVHMGGGGSHYVEGDELYTESRKIGLEYPNIFFIESAKRDTHIESDLITYQLAGSPYKENIACGSDAPYGRMSWNFGGYRKMFESLLDPNHPDERVRNNPGLFTHDCFQKFLGGNLASLYIDACEKVLEKAGVQQI